MMFSVRLKIAREANGLSQAELARKVGVSRDLLNKYEKAGVEPSYIKLLRLADCLNVSVDYLLGKESTGGPTHTEIKSDISKNENVESADPDIRRIERAKRKMPEKEWEKQMNIIKASFADYFSEDYIDDDLDE